jgi:hypothetical protein
MQVVYALEPLPETTTRSIFLAGPTPRAEAVAGFRPAAVLALQQQGFDGVVFVPEPRDGSWARHYDDQIEWEEAALHRADCILFWVPRDMQTLPGLTTNVEWGAWASSGKVVLGAPSEAAHVRYLQYYAAKLSVPVETDLAAAVAAAIRAVGPGALRVGGECEVPLLVWRHPTFQGWYTAQRVAGHRLDGARVLWSYFAGAKRDFFFAWALRVSVYVASEGRHKREVVIGRTDVCSVLLYRRGATILDTEVVLVREVRGAARSADGMVHELPGGSSWHAGDSALDIAVHEVEEETGFRPAGLARGASRQLASTLLAHQATLFSAELSATDLACIRADPGIARGVAEDGERTYTEVRTVRAILDGEQVDWSTIGMILSVLAPLFEP